jgi:hypothetical protein
LEFLSEPLKPKTITTMKKHLSKKTLWQSLLSAIALGITILIAVGSLGASAKETKKDLGGGRVEKTIEYTFVDGATEIFTGIEDEYGIRNGSWTIKTISADEEFWTKEELTYVNGIRTGISKFTDSSGKLEYKCYRNGRAYPCTKGEQIIAEDVSAFQVLTQSYPWFADKLYMISFENEYVEAYLDSLETILDEFGDDPLEFDNYYDDAVDSLTYTPYDSLIQRNSTFSLIQGEEEMKKDEFRMAIIDRYRSNGSNTYNIMKNTYPGYLESIIKLEITDENFKGFCHITDSLMDGNDALHGSLDQENVFFVDSVDQRLYRALAYILEYEDTTSALKSMKINSILNKNYDIIDIFKELRSQLNQPNIDSTTQQAAGAVLLFMLLKLDQGDMMKLSVKEAWFNKREVVTVPNVFTEFTSSNSATSVSLLGEVLEDGGGAVSSRGIAWADFYNPTTSDNSKTSGTGLGTFAITLDNLIEGTTYYARAYATNSAGTAYGNCITFTVGESVGIDDNEIFVREFSAFPNPAANFTTFSFNVETSEDMALTLVNLKGQAVFHHDLGRLTPGENRVELDLSELPNGIYSCQLNNNGMIRSTCKILIVH